MVLATGATLGNTVGAALVGLVGASILFGITVVQVYMYYLYYTKDWVFQKISVGLLCLLDALHLALTLHAVYYYLVDQYGNPLALNNFVWSLKLQLLINVVIVLYVQTLYALRIWKLGVHFNRFWPISVCVIVAAGYAVGIALVISTYNTHIFSDIHKSAWVVYASFASSTSIDIIIAGVICYYLQRSRTSLAATNYRILRVMHYVLISGFLTGACSLSALITYGSMPSNLIFLGIEFLLTKLYINSYIAMLNARRAVRDDTVSSFSVSGVWNVTDAVGEETQQGATSRIRVPNDARSQPVDLPLSTQSRVENELTPFGKRRTIESSASQQTQHVRVYKREGKKDDSDYV